MHLYILHQRYCMYSCRQNPLLNTNCSWRQATLKDKPLLKTKRSWNCCNLTLIPSKWNQRRKKLDMHLHISYTKDMLEGHLNHEIFNAGLSNFNHEFFNHWVEKFMVEKSVVEMSFNLLERWHFNPGLFNPRLFNHDFFNPMVQKFMVQKSKVDMSFNHFYTVLTNPYQGL